MEYKKDLTQMALTALILASLPSVNAQQNDIAKYSISLSCENEGLMLAVSCAAHGCPSLTNGVKESNKPDSGNRDQGTRVVTPSENSQTGKQNPQGNSPKENPRNAKGANEENTRAKRDGGNSKELSYMTPSERAYSNSSYNSQRSGITSPVYVEDYRSDTFYSRPLPYPEYGETTLNREYNTTTDYDYNRASVTTVTSSNTLTEAQLLGMLNSQGQAIYLNLDPEGKSLAIQLASQDSYRDKNLAVKEAQRRMNERRGLMIRR